MKEEKVDEEKCIDDVSNLGSQKALNLSKLIIFVLIENFIFLTGPGYL